MKPGIVKSYILVVLTGLIMLAAALLVILQWGNSSSFSVYGKNFGENTPGGLNTGLIMVCCLVAGPAVLGLCKIMIRSGLEIRRHRKAHEGKTET